MRRSILLAALIVIALLITVEASAEIRVVTGRAGEYRETRILLPDSPDVVGSSSAVWTPIGRSSEEKTLNPDGADGGDLWPTVRETGEGPYYAWAVWSRLRGSTYDLAWSRWTVDGWQEIVWVGCSPNDFGDELDADLAFDANGRPYVVWWRDGGDRGHVFLSLFLQNRWMSPFAVSDLSIDGRYPSIEILADGTIEVTYETPDGTVVQSVEFTAPVTITDDIDPLDHTSSTRMHYAENPTP